MEWGDGQYPSTRYQGSKRKLLPWIYDETKDLGVESVIDLFGGTGVVSYLFKKMGMKVTYNDYLKSNYYIGKALIENQYIRLSESDITFLVKVGKSENPSFVEDTFGGMYYTEEENKWIDCVVGNIRKLNEKYSGPTAEYKMCLAYYALYQSCLVKRPFNMFHRRNLYLRMAEVTRSFGNKTSWDTPFEVLFRKFSREVDRLVFSNNNENRAINKDVLAIDKGNYDLVYIDPPYFNKDRSNSQADYRKMYHFLEGLAYYDTWGHMIDYKSRNLHLIDDNNTWKEKDKIIDNLKQIFDKFRDSVIILSYKSPGIPEERGIVSLLKEYKNNVIVNKKQYIYALNKSNGKPNKNIEMLIVGK